MVSTENDDKRHGSARQERETLFVRLRIASSRMLRVAWGPATALRQESGIIAAQAAKNQATIPPAPTIALVLPQEMVDYIIDYLHDDTPALKQCSLVCRAWVHSSSRYIFFSISWPPSSATRRTKGRYSRDLRSFLANAPRICENLREIRIRGYWYTFTTSTEYDQSRTFISASPHAGMLDWLDLVPRLRCLNVCPYSYTQYPRLHVHAPQHERRHIDQLQISASWVASPFDIESFLHLFYQFSSVSVLQFQCDSVSTALRSSIRPLPHLIVPPPDSLPRVETLIFDGGCNGGHQTSTHAVADVLDLIKSCIDLSSLKHLVLDIHVPPHGPLGPALSVFLRRTASLESLTFGCALDPATRIVFPPTLRELRLRGRRTIHPRDSPHAIADPGARHWPWLFRLPGTLLAQAIPSVSMELAMQKIILWDQSGMPAFDDVEEDLRAALERFEWTRLESLAGKVGNFTLHLMLDLSEQPSSEARLGYHRAIRDSCRQLVPLNVRDIVQFHVS